MARHIHIHLDPVRTVDSGNWDESKHPRASNGQFGTGGGQVNSGNKARLKILEGQYARLDKNAPLRVKAKLAAEIKALKSSS